MGSPSDTPRRRDRLPRTALVLLAVGALFVAGCKGRSGKGKAARKGCTARKLEQVRSWLGDLCAAHEQSIATPHAHWRGLRLARADVTPLDKLPGGVLIHLTRQRLLIDGKPAPDWPKRRDWTGPDLRRGVGPALGKLLPGLRKKLGTNQQVSRAAATALKDLVGRARPLAPRLRPRTYRPGAKAPPSKPQPSGLTLLTLTMAKLRVPGKGPRAALLAVDPDVELWRLVQLQPLLALAGFDGLYVLFTPRTSPDPPAAPDPAVYSGLGVLKSGRDHRAILAARSRALAQEEAGWLQQGCADMNALRKALYKAPAASRCRTLEKRLPGVLKACRCVRDERTLLTLWLAALEPFDHLGAWQGSLHPRAKPVRASEITLWRDLADRVAQRERKTLWFALQ